MAFRRKRRPFRKMRRRKFGARRRQSTRPMRVGFRM